MYKIRRIVLLMAFAAVTSTVFVPTLASASSNEGSAGMPDIVVPTGTVKEGVLGDVVFLASQNVPAGLQGARCAATVTPMNNESHREQTDIIVSSGGSSVVEPNVESKDHYVPQGPQVLTLGDVVEVYVRLGEHPQPGDPNHGAFSGGVTVSFSDCHAPPVLIPVCRGGVEKDIPREEFNPATDVHGKCLPQCEHSSNFGQTNPDCPVEQPPTYDIDTAISAVRPASPVQVAVIRTTG